MAYHITLVIKGVINWESPNYCVVVNNKRSNPIRLALAIDICRSFLLKGKNCFIEQQGINTP